MNLIVQGRSLRGRQLGIWLGSRQRQGEEGREGEREMERGGEGGRE